MKTRDVLVARVYVMESSHLLQPIINYLKNEADIQGISVFRAISGSGKSGTHQASLLNLSLDLPLAIEFFDEQQKMQVALEHLNGMVKAGHILVWDAKTNI